MSPPGRTVAALGSAVRALVVNVVLLALLVGVAAVVRVAPYLVLAPFAFFVGVYFGGLAGVAAGAVHAVAQLALMLAVPAHRRRPWSPALAVAVSAALVVATAVYAWGAPDVQGDERRALLLAGAVYVVATWPVANAVVPPGRPRRRGARPRPRPQPPPDPEPTPWG